MSYAVEVAAWALYRLGRSREAASLVGAVEAAYAPLTRRAEEYRTSSKAFASVLSAGLDEHRIAGRELSLERATALALRVIDEELAAASAAVVREGGGAAGVVDTPRRQGP
jgi:hypothetical protein